MLEEITSVSSSREIRHPDIAQIRVFNSPEETAVESAHMIMSLVGHNPTASITYATGVTMEPVYGHIAREVRAGTVDMSRTNVFHLDERYPSSLQDPSGFAHFVSERVVQPFGIEAGNAFFWDGSAPDPEAEAARYNGLLAQNRINLAILGIGPPGKTDPRKGGHIAFNEPGTPFESEAHFVPVLSEETLTRDRSERGETVPDGALTQGIANILRADQILLVAYGSQKGRALYHALYEPVHTDCPASALRLVAPEHKVYIYVDQMAAAALQYPEE